jgi:plastocyanin
MAVLSRVRHGGRGLSRKIFVSGFSHGARWSLNGRLTLSPLLAMWVTVLASMSCGVGSGTESRADAALRDTLGIGPRVGFHIVALGGSRDSERISPARLEVSEGDVVVFETVDGRVHALEFATDSLSPEVVTFLRETRQLKSPPLMDLGTKFLVDFEDAPDGRYVFRGRTVGDPVYAVILIGVTPP